MGVWSRFNCPQCGYQAMVSGGHDSGREEFTVTIVCLDCRELHDVTIGRRDTPDSIPPRCPRAKRHTVRPWQGNGPCPRCDTPMQDQGGACLWD